MSLKIMSDEYIELSEIDHCLARSDIYIGSRKLELTELHITNLDENGKPFFVKKPILYSEGFRRPFIEGFSNMTDNLQRSIKDKIDPGDIKIETDGKTMIFYNEGRAINIKRHPKSNNIWTPEMIFGRLRTSNNFDDTVNRQTAGRFGLGAKLINIYSKNFDIEIANKNQNIIYKQSYSNNMREKTEAIISEYKGDKSYVKISYVLDFDYFYDQHKDIERKYMNDTMCLFMKYIIDSSFIYKIPIYFNNIKFQYSSFEEYVGLYGINLNECNHIVFRDKESEICIIDTAYVSNTYSFVNGLPVESGVHVEAWMDLITEIISPKFVEKNKKNEEKKKITKREVRQHLTIFLNCFLDKPTFDSQTKLHLKSPKPKMTIEYSVLEQMYEWDIMNALESYIKGKESKILKKTDGSKNKYVDVEKLNDAPAAGTKESQKCVLMISEGDSAVSFALDIIGQLGDEKRPYLGCYPLRGKLLNTQKAKVEKIMDNRVITELKNIIGLKENVDYTIDHNFNGLRYGKILILSDADLDGIHIRMLFVNIFGTQYKSLLQRGFIGALITPLIKCKMDRAIKWFYSPSEYSNWIKEDPTRIKYKIDYKKGLASFDRKDKNEIPFIAKQLLIVNYFWDENAENSLSLAFGDKSSDLRKQWLNSWSKDLEMYVPKISNENRNISDAINKELILYSRYSLQRAIPKLDGLKTVQRKILFVSLKSLKEPTKVSNFAGRVIEECDYDHGNTSIEEAVIGLAQTFTNSNNISLLRGVGGFGSRMMNGDDSGSSRYIKVALAPITKYIFRDEDSIILKFLEEGGERSKEPATYYPIIPMSVINGLIGIGTGYSTKTPSYNPSDIINWIKILIKAKKENKSIELPKLIPWYRYFKGKIYEDGKGNIISEGIFEINDKNNKICYVREIPIGVSINDYQSSTLSSLIKNKVIAGFKPHSKSNDKNMDDMDIKIEIEGMNNPSNKKLGLVRNISTTNMTYLDENNEIKKYKHINDLLKDFFIMRLQKYGERKIAYLKYLESDIIHKKLKAKFIEDVINEKLVIKNRNIEELVIEMNKYKYPKEFLDFGLKTMTKEGLNKLKDEITKVEDEYKLYKERDILDIWYEELDMLEKRL